MNKICKEALHEIVCKWMHILKTHYEWEHVPRVIPEEFTFDGHITEYILFRVQDKNNKDFMNITYVKRECRWMITFDSSGYQFGDDDLTAFAEMLCEMDEYKEQKDGS